MRKQWENYIEEDNASELRSWIHNTFPSPSQGWGIRGETRIEKTSHSLIRSPTHEFPSREITSRATRDYVARNSHQTLASLKFWIGIRGIAQQRSDSGTDSLSLAENQRSRQRHTDGKHDEIITVESFENIC